MLVTTDDMILAENTRISALYAEYNQAFCVCSWRASAASRVSSPPFPGGFFFDLLTSLYPMYTIRCPVQEPCEQPPPNPARFGRKQR